MSRKRCPFLQVIAFLFGKIETAKRTIVQKIQKIKTGNVRAFEPVFPHFAVFNSFYVTVYLGHQHRKGFEFSFRFKPSRLVEVSTSLDFNTSKPKSQESKKAAAPTPYSKGAGAVSVSLSSEKGRQNSSRSQCKRKCFPSSSFP